MSANTLLAHRRRHYQCIGWHTVNTLNVSANTLLAHRQRHYQCIGWQNTNTYKHGCFAILYVIRITSGQHIGWQSTNCRVTGMSANALANASTGWVLYLLLYLINSYRLYLCTQWLSETKPVFVLYSGQQLTHIHAEHISSYTLLWQSYCDEEMLYWCCGMSRVRLWVPFLMVFSWLVWRG